MKRAALLLAWAACSDGGGGHATPIDAYRSMGTGATCAELTSSITDFETGADATPINFPPAPVGVVLCGTDPNVDTGGPTQGWYLTGDLTLDDVFTYYEAKLGSDGYTVSAPTTEPGGNNKLVFTTEITAGSVVYNTDELFLLLTYPSS